MTPAQLAAAGQRLYGKRWQTPLARHLGVNPRTVRRWAAGQIEVPRNVSMEIGALLIVYGNPPLPTVELPRNAVEMLEKARARLVGLGFPHTLGEYIVDMDPPPDPGQPGKWEAVEAPELGDAMALLKGRTAEFCGHPALLDLHAQTEPWLLAHVLIESQSLADRMNDSPRETVARAAIRFGAACAAAGIRG